MTTLPTAPARGAARRLSNDDFVCLMAMAHEAWLRESITAESLYEVSGQAGWSMTETRAALDGAKKRGMLKGV